MPFSLRRQGRGQADRAAGREQESVPAVPAREPSDSEILRSLVDRSTARARNAVHTGMQDSVLGNGARTENVRTTPGSPRATLDQAVHGTGSGGNSFLARTHQDVGGTNSRPGAAGNRPATPAAPAAERAGQAEVSDTPASGTDGGRDAGGDGRSSLGARLLARCRQAGIFLACLAGFVLFLFLVYKGSLGIYNWLHTSEMFVIRHIDVAGNVRLNRDMILRLGGVEEGINTFDVDVFGIEHRLRKTPWVEDVSVKRVLPDRFVIRVRERMPSFWVRRGGNLFYANERGEPIAPVEGENFLSLPILSIEEGCEDAIPYLARLMRDVRSGILPVEAGAVATVDVSPSRGVELYLEDREMRLSLAPDDWEGNLLRLGVTIGDLARRRELGSVQEVRASDGSVWVVLRRSAQ